METAATTDWDRDAWLAAVALSGRSIVHAPASLRNDREVVLAAVSNWSGALRYAGAELAADREIAIAAVSNSRFAWSFVSAALYSDRDVVLAGVSNWGCALESMNDEFRADRQVVLAAVSESGRALEYADDVFKQDSEIVMRAVENDGLAIEHCLISDRSPLVPDALDLAAVADAATQDNPTALTGLPATAREQIAAAYRAREAIQARAWELAEARARNKDREQIATAYRAREAIVRARDEDRAGLLAESRARERAEARARRRAEARARGLSEALGASRRCTASMGEIALSAQSREHAEACAREIAEARARELIEENDLLHRRLEGSVVTVLNVETGVEELVELAPLLTTTARAPPRSALRVEADHTARVGAIKEERDYQTEELGYRDQCIAGRDDTLDRLKRELAERGATIDRLEAETRSLRSKVSIPSRRPVGLSNAAPRTVKRARRSAAS